MAFNPTKGVVQNEDCDLHYWYQGQGPLITFVPGGNGHGRQFNPIIAALSAKFTCATFDRRQMSASQVKVNKKLNPPQQARDIAAVIKAVGFEKSIIFGSSAGGIFAMQLALDMPEIVDHIISHEAPTTLLLPDSSAQFESLLRLQEVYETQGMEQAAREFSKKLIGYGDEGIPKTVSPEPENPRNFWDNEFHTLLSYVPNMWRLKENKISIGVMRGIRCKDAIFSRTTVEQAKILDCPHAVVPGHHQGFEVETDEFVPYLLEMLETLEKKRGGN